MTKRSATQLPNDAPALIMVEMLRAPGGFRLWEPILERRFQPTAHTRVGGMGLFGLDQRGAIQGKELFSTPS
jgi:hypothetical protein